MKTVSLEQFDKYIETHPGVTGKAIKQDLNITEARFFLLSHKSTAKRIRQSMQTVYWFGDAPPKTVKKAPEKVKLAEIARPEIKRIEFAKLNMPILTRWVGGNPFVSMAHNC
jgi:hypothetical protein